MTTDDAVSLPASVEQAQPPISDPAPRWLAYAFAVCSLALLPWTIWLYQSLPSRATADNWDVAWAGFDVALAGTLLATAAGALRRSTWTQGAAASAATLLVCDAWFDVITSRTVHQFEVAVVMAAFAEAPLALVCVWVARNSDRVVNWRVRRRRPPAVPR